MHQTGDRRRVAARHHPFNVAQRMVQLDHMTGGRAIFGSGPGALVPDARTLGVDPMVLRDRQDEAIGIIRRLFNVSASPPDPSGSRCRMPPCSCYRCRKRCRSRLPLRSARPA